MKKLLSIGAMLVVFGLIVAACSDDSSDDTTTTAAPTTTAAEETSVLDLAVEAGQFSTLIAAIDAAGLAETLEGEGPFTVLAPTDAAFSEALEALNITAEELLADTETLTAILTYHVIPQAADSQLVATLDGQSVATVNGQEVAISVVDGQIMVDQATVVSADLEADNGIVHAINGVLLPPDVAQALGVAAAPETTTTTTAPPETTTTTEAETEPTIAEIVVEAAGGDPAEFTVLLAAVQAADPSVLALMSDPDAAVTVFAPTDAAFVEALETLGLTAEEILGDQELVTSILLYHVLDGVFVADDVVGLDGQSVETLNPGESVSITITDDGGVRLNDGVAPLGGSNVVQVDVLASNGVIHVIDALLINESILGS